MSDVVNTKFQFVNELNLKDTDWKKEKYIISINDVLFFLNIMVNKTTGIKIVSMLDRDVIVFSNDATSMHYLTMPNNVELTAKIVKSGSSKFIVNNSFMSRMLKIGTLVELNQFNIDSFFYNVINGLIEDNYVNYILISPAIALTSNFSNIQPCGKIITYMESINYSGYEGKRFKINLFNIFKGKQINAHEKHFSNCYFSSNAFITVR